MSLPPPEPLLSISLAVVMVVVWTGPLGLLVLRKRLANASGARLVVKRALAALSVLTAPAAAFMVLIVVAGVREDVALLWSALQNSW